MTHKLYYEDAYLAEFRARLTGSGDYDGRPAVTLDRTAFYAEGGGQPADHGLLGGVEVLDVQERDGQLWHVLSRPLALAPGDQLAGAIDWRRRFDLMQQHHGQHLLSAAFEQSCGAATLSVHMGEQSCTVDLDRATLSAEQAGDAEQLANQMVWANLAVHARFVSADELARLPLRKPPSVSGPIRIVSAGEFDHSACGGTHPLRTGEVGGIVVRRWERRGEQTRVEFVCGGRALADYRWKNALLSSLAGAMSVGAAELPEALLRLRAAEERSRKALQRAQEQLLGYQAGALLDQADRLPSGLPLVVCSSAEWTAEWARSLARQLSERGATALLGVEAQPAQLVFARPSGQGPDLGALLREAVALLGGRGGGRPEFAQGGGPEQARLAEALEQARRTLLEQPL